MAIITAEGWNCLKTANDYQGKYNGTSICVSLQQLWQICWSLHQLENWIIGTGSKMYLQFHLA